MEASLDALNIQTLENVNRVARAANLWIHHQRSIAAAIYCRSTIQADRHFAAGVIVGLCDALGLDARHAILSAYAYALLDGEVESALGTVQALLDDSRSAVNADAYSDGQLAAIRTLAAVDIAPGTGARPMPAAAPTIKERCPGSERVD